MRHSLFFLFVLLFFGCYKESSTEQNNQKSVTSSNQSIIEGTVFYFEGGGTVEMPYPAGYRLLYAHWLTSTPDSASGPVYLKGAVDPSFVDKNVRVVGLVTVSISHGTAPGYVYSWVNLTVDSIQVIP